MRLDFILSYVRVQFDDFGFAQTLPISQHVVRSADPAPEMRCLPLQRECMNQHAVSSSSRNVHHIDDKYEQLSFA